MFDEESLKLRIYHILPSPLRYLATHLYIWMRALSERWYAAAAPSARVQTFPRFKIIFMSGMHRSGTSLVKNYLGDHLGLTPTPFDPAGFHKIWKQAQRMPGIVVAKSNHYIDAAPNIIRVCGRGAVLSVVVRDPRDVLFSLLSWPHSLNIPRGKRFWEVWAAQQNGYLTLASKNGGRGILFHLLRYEDLLTHPVAVKTHFIRCLGIEPQHIDNRYRILFPGESQDAEVVKYTVIRPGNSAKWRDEADPRCRPLLAGWKKCRPAAHLMEKFGYTEPGEINAIEPLANISFWDGKE